MSVHSGWEEGVALRRHILALLVALAAAAFLIWPGQQSALGNPLTQVTQITTGGSRTCALLDGGVKCWGNNSGGGLGDGTRTFRTTPTDVVGLQEGVVSVATAGSHTCALLDTGRVKCWGANLIAELGDGTITTRTSPVDVCQVYDEALEQCDTPLSSVTAIAAGTFHNCALTEEATVFCWGRNTHGQLGAVSDGKCSFGGGPFPLALEGPNPELCSTTALEVAGLTDVVAVDAGGNHTCAVTIEGRVKCWGANLNRELGTPTTEICLEVGVVPVDCSTAPVDVCLAYDEAAAQCDELLAATAVATGGSHTCAVTAAGGAMCWGANFNGALGDGTGLGDVFPPSSPPVDVVGLTQGIAQIAVGTWTSCAVTAEALLFCWGGNEQGQLGDGTGGRSGDRSLVPVSVCEDAVCDAPLANVVAVSVGFHTCALLEEASVRCWGSNTWGQLGDGTICCGLSYNRPAPVDVVALEAKPTPTPTLTPTPTVTLTPTTTPAPTMTPEVLLGDVNCDGTLTSVDAVLVLQFVARLLQTLPCPENGDIDEDGALTALDAALILQHSAGLLASA